MKDNNNTKAYSTSHETEGEATVIKGQKSRKRKEHGRKRKRSRRRRRWHSSGNELIISKADKTLEIVKRSEGNNTRTHR